MRKSMIGDYIKRAVKPQPYGMGRTHNPDEWVKYNLACVKWLWKHRKEKDSRMKRKNMQRDVLNTRPCVL